MTSQISVTYQNDDRGRNNDTKLSSVYLALSLWCLVMTSQISLAIRRFSSLVNICPFDS